METLEAPINKPLDEIEPDKYLEGYKEVELKIDKPDGIHNIWGMSFVEEDRKLVTAYNLAITEIGKEMDEKQETSLRLFHQGGIGTASGWHLWEFWTYIDEDRIQKLLSLIHEKAKNIYKMLSEIEGFEYWIRDDVGI